MAINKQFLIFKNNTTFEATKENISKKSIVFINDINAIWTHDKYFYCSQENVKDSIDSIVALFDNYVERKEGYDLSQNDFTDELKESLENLINIVSSPLNYKGSVDTYQDLENIENPDKGDVYNVIEDNMNYAWTGSTWDQFGTSAIEVINDITTGGSTVALSAQQGVELKKLIDQEIDDRIQSVATEVARAKYAEETLDAKIDTKQNIGNYVEYTQLENGRKIITLDNAELINAYSNSEELENKVDVEGAISLIQLNRWNVVNIGSPKTITNINVPDGYRPTVQEASQSGPEAHKIAYLDDVTDLADVVTETLVTKEELESIIEEINSTLDWYEEDEE